MRKILDKLSAEQEALLPVYRDRWLKIGLQTNKQLPSRERLLELFAAVYKAGGIPPPRVIITLANPLEGCIGSAILQCLGGGQVWGQVWDRVGGQVRDQVWDQVGGQVWGQVWNQVWDQVGGQVWGQVWNQVWDRVWDQVRDQVWGQIGDQVRDQVWGQIGDQVGDQVGGQVWDQVRGQVWGQVRGQVWGQVWDRVGGQVWNQIYRCGWGTHDAGWLSFYNYFLEQHPEVQGTAHIISLMNLAKEGIGWWWPFEGGVIVTSVPLAIHRNANGRLHNTSGPAIEYPGDWRIYALNGIRFQGDMEKYAALPVAELDYNSVLSIKNVEQRAEVIKRIGIPKLFERLNPIHLDKWEEYELYKISIGYPTPRIYLRMNNPSIKEIHIEAVHPDCTTVKQALAWRNFGKIDIPYSLPLKLT